MKTFFQALLLATTGLLLSACGGTGNTDYFALQIEATGDAGFYRARMDAGKQTAQGGMILAGKNNDNLWLMKFNAQGDVLWQNTYMPVFSVYRGLFLLPGDAYAVAGITGDGEAFLQVLESDGSVRFLKTYPDFYFKAAHKANNGFFFLGEHADGGGLLHLTDAGDLISSKSYSDIGPLHAILELPDGELIATGERGNMFSEEGRLDLTLLKLSADLNLISARVYGGENTGFYPAGLYLGANQQIILGGNLEYGTFTDQNNFQEPIKLIIDDNLEITNAKKYRFNKQARILDLLPTDDGGSLLMGRFSQTDNDFSQSHPVLVKLNQTGTLQWAKRYEFPRATGGTAIQLTRTDQGYLMAGTYTASGDYGFAISTNLDGVIEESGFDVDNLTNGTASSFNLSEYSYNISAETVAQEVLLHAAPIPQSSGAKLTRH